MSKFLKFIVLIFLRCGWMIPLSYSLWVEHQFLTQVVWSQARWNIPYDYPFHLVEIAPYIFFISMVWIFALIVIHLIWDEKDKTRRRLSGQGHR